MIQEITTKEEFEKIVSEDNKDRSILKFHAAWCGPCKAYAGVFEDFAKAHKDDMKFYSIDVDNIPEAVKKFEISSIPLTIVLVKGAVQETHKGFLTQDELTKNLL